MAEALKKLAPRNWRTQEMHNSYEELRNTRKPDGCPLCSEPNIREFKFWKIMKNRFPYDAIAKKHDMILPIRHCVESELTDDEKLELKQLKTTFLNNEYGFIMEALPNRKSIPGHFHLHLVVPKVIE